MDVSIFYILNFFLKYTYLSCTKGPSGPHAKVVRKVQYRTTGHFGQTSTKKQISYCNSSPYLSKNNIFYWNIARRQRGFNKIPLNCIKNKRFRYRVETIFFLSR